MCSNFLPGTWLLCEQRHLQGEALTLPGLRLGVQSRASGMPAEGCRQGQPRKAASLLSHLRHLLRPRPCSQAPPPPSRPRPHPGPAHTCVGQEAVAFVPCHVIDTRALVETRVGCALVDVGLAVGAWRERKRGQCGRHPGCWGQVLTGVEEKPCSEPGALEPTPAGPGATGSLNR